MCTGIGNTKDRCGVGDHVVHTVKSCVGVIIDARHHECTTIAIEHSVVHHFHLGNASCRSEPSNALSRARLLVDELTHRKDD